MTLNKTSLILFIIVAIGFFFRIYQLSNVPPSASLDEATTGWNAYSIMLTGKDEYGYKFPILLRAYDDFRPALYVYFVVPFIKVLGVDVLAVRLPSAILGSLSVLITYFLVVELFFKYKYKSYLGLMSAFLLSISPWSIYISRLGHEANAGFAFTILAIFIFLKFKNTLKGSLLCLSSVFFALSFYAYQSEKVFIPLMVIALAFLFRKELMQRKKYLIISIAVGLIILAPVLKETLSPNGLIRLRGTTAFDITQPEYTQAATERLKAKQSKDFVKEVVNNNRIISTKIFLGNYISHFSPIWLFSNTGLDSFKAPGVGLLHLFGIILIPVGVFFLMSGKFDKKIKILLIAWIFIAPIGGSISTGAPQAMRFYNVLPTFQLLSSLGFIYLISSLKKDMSKKAFAVVFFALAVVSLAYFSKQYFIEFPKASSASFQYSLSKAVPYVLQNNLTFSKVVFSNRRNLGQSYMFFLFYSKYNPVSYQIEGGTGSGGFEKFHRIGKYEFDTVDLRNISRGVLYLANPSEAPAKGDKYFYIKNFDDLDGNTSITTFYIK